MNKNSYNRCKVDGRHIVLTFCVYIAVILFIVADIPIEWRERWSSKKLVT